LSHVSRDAVAALDGVSEPEIEVLLEDLRELPVVYSSMRVALPRELSPALEHLTDTYAVGDLNGAWGPLDAILEEIDMAIERARLVRAVLALRDEGRLDQHSAAAAAFELGSGSRELLRECMTEAIAAWVSDAYVRRGIAVGLSVTASEGEPGRAERRANSISGPARPSLHWRRFTVRPRRTLIARPRRRAEQDVQPRCEDAVYRAWRPVAAAGAPGWRRAGPQCSCRRGVD
jgi:hypothetical protein